MYLAFASEDLKYLQILVFSFVCYRYYSNTGITVCKTETWRKFALCNKGKAENGVNVTSVISSWECSVLGPCDLI